MSNNDDRRIEVPILARVEGEGALTIHLEQQQIKMLNLRIYEPPRLFEKFLEGRSYTEVVDMVARICGICPVAYQMSAAHALEQCFDLAISPWVRALRRVFYCGEWLESHSLHIHFLAAPDFAGFSNAIDMAKAYPEVVKRGMRLQHIGHQLIALLGGRAVNPVGAKVGGFFKAPRPEAVTAMLAQIDAAIPDAIALLDWVGQLPLPAQQQDFVSVSLSHPNEYPMNEGRIRSTAGLDIAIEDYAQYFTEFQVPHSTALHCLLQGQAYLVGPLARLNLNYGQVPAVIRAQLDALGFSFPSANMHHSIIARAVEVYYCLLEAQRILRDYTYPDAPAVPVAVKAGRGFGCTEAPRGLLWHEFSVDDQGLVLATRIVPPTSQNQARIEADLREGLLAYGITKPLDQVRARAEMIIRNYDPCISCSTHFLKLEIKE